MIARIYEWFSCRYYTDYGFWVKQTYSRKLGRSPRSVKRKCRLGKVCEKIFTKPSSGRNRVNPVHSTEAERLVPVGGDLEESVGALTSLLAMIRGSGWQARSGMVNRRGGGALVSESIETRRRL